MLSHSIRVGGEKENERPLSRRSKNAVNTMWSADATVATSAIVMPIVSALRSLRHAPSNSSATPHVTLIIAQKRTVLVHDIVTDLQPQIMVIVNQTTRGFIVRSAFNVLPSMWSSTTSSRELFAPYNAISAVKQIIIETHCLSRSRLLQHALLWLLTCHFHQ